MKKKRDLELEAGARVHFDDPAYYTSTYADRTEDVDYYVRVAVEHDVRAVFEQGIGNGRIALPLARMGIRVAGVDLSKPMLDDLRARLANEPKALRDRITLARGDIRKARVTDPRGRARRFPLVFCAFNTALHLYTREDVEQWLARVREHLAPGGTLVFDVSMPILEDLARDPAVPYRTPPFDHPSLGRVNYAEYFDYDRVRQILFVAMCFEPRAKKTATKVRSKARSDARDRTGEDPQSLMTPLAHRQFYPREIEALLHYNGFVMQEQFGDWEEGPLTQRSDVMIIHARARGAR